MIPRLILINDDEAARADLERIAREVGFVDFRQTGKLQEANELITHETFEVAIIDVNLDESRPLSTEGLDLIRTMRQLHPECLILADTGHFATQSIAYGIKAIRSGATDFICEQWFDINHEELLTLKLKIWFYHLAELANKQVSLAV